MEEKKSYKVSIKNAKECQIELTFPDLCIKYTNGFSPALKIKEGQEIPLDICDPEDIRKSWIAGSLKGYLENKWIEEIPLDSNKSNLIEVKNSSQFIVEQDIKSLPKIDNPSQTILPEVIQVVEQQPISVSSTESITDLAKIFSYEDFCKLSHFLKLRFIKETENLDLLRDITGKTPSNQFKNNIALRLSQVKVQ